MSHPEKNRTRRSLVSFGVTALLAMTAATAQVATGTASADIDASGSYRQEVQACMSGRTQQDRDACLQEARNAQAAKQRGKLETYGNHEANALARCEPLIGEDKAACQARVMGYGSTSGSVAGGGILREVETVVLPPGQTSITIEPKTSEPVVLVPTEPSR
ncbi:hypothetical protein [Ramlibacter tataouinensis]|uniref:Uncharacterized protein n=1 Tax=Ramlibacter tataouinensis (strain ATCC BAA-407 / DSM 14655 / LMG 21543 / TTB310) TaxID=365046 RepID=F5XY60_RAMTT|nr:hypothetical protein [Ramlibacter tataouinensis]AEG94385.1 conserved hypothetical protein [Ramlibacter tataouinensis TTB310]